ncbi:MAG TPA: hypothetical protein VLV50_19680 [Stellaceae bacterium]|nr:hypothetical protein [Stellaceae bacterium]
MTFAHAFLEPDAARSHSAEHSSILHPVALLAGLSVVSALLSNALPGPEVGLGYFQFPVLPGIYFGLVLVFGAASLATTNLWRLLALFAAVNAGWAVAYVASFHFYDSSFQRLLSPWGDSFWSCGLVGGAIGAVLTVCGVACASPNFRTIDNFLRTLAIGTLAGLLLECGEKSSPLDALPIHLGSVLPLFLAWQTAVAASIAYGLIGAPRVVR